MSHLCQPCGKAYSVKRSLDRHCREPAHCARVGTSLIPQYRCTWPGCGKLFARDDIRARHTKEMHHNRRRPRDSLRPQQKQPRMLDASSSSPGGRRCLELAEITELGSTAASATDEERLRNLGPENLAQVRLPSQPVEQDACGLADAQEAAELPELVDVSTTSEPSEPTHNGRLDASMREVDIHDVDVPAVLDFDDSQWNELQLPYPGNGQLDVLQSEAYSRKMNESPCASPNFPPVAFVLPLLPRSKLLEIGSNSRSSSNQVPPCPLCREDFGHNSAEIAQHIEVHLKNLNGQHVCEQCQIGFVHRADLDKHLQSALSDVHCGFNFEHQDACTGHHPPGEFDEFLTDRDRAALSCQLQNWELSQLRAFMCALDDAVQARVDKTSETRWSVGPTMKRTGSACSVRSNFSAPGTTFVAPGALFPDDSDDDRHNVSVDFRLASQQPALAPIQQPSQRATQQSGGLVLSMACHHDDCAESMFRYKTISALRHHQRKHVNYETGENVCEDCGKKFIFYKDLLRHYWKHAPNTLACPVPDCGRVFKRSDHRERHIGQKHPGWKQRSAR